MTPKRCCGGMHRRAEDLRDQLGASLSHGAMKLLLPKESSQGSRGEPVKRIGEVFQGDRAKDPRK